MIWLIGSRGMLGSEIVRHLTQNKIPWIGTNSEVDITNFQALESFEKTIETSSYYPSQLSHAQRKVQWIINCAGFSNVDAAETESEKTNSLNITGAQNIARLCREIGAKLIHFSSSFVFDGNANIPYTEDAKTNPLTVYGKSKLQSEIEIERLMNTYYIIRTSCLYGFGENNFLQKIIKDLNSESEIKIAEDLTGTPTNCSDVADAVLKLIEKADSATSLFGKNSAPNYGIYNFTDGGQTSFYNFVETVKKISQKSGILTGNCKIIPCKFAELENKATYPLFSVLNKDKITKTLKLKIPAWESSLDKFFKSK